MTPDEMRIAVAEACGWTEVAWEESGIGVYLFGYPPGTVKPETSSIDFAGLVMTLGRKAKTHAPDYPADLNAMHEAEKVLTNEQFDRYRVDLWTVVGNQDFAFEGCAPLTAVRCFISATAAQRCEAFLRTLGRWREGEGGT
jgi:hypothetical protein